MTEIKYSAGDWCLNKVPLLGPHRVGAYPHQCTDCKNYWEDNNEVSTGPSAAGSSNIQSADSAGISAQLLGESGYRNGKNLVVHQFTWMGEEGIDFNDQVREVLNRLYPSWKFSLLTHVYTRNSVSKMRVTLAGTTTTLRVGGTLSVPVPRLYTPPKVSHSDIPAVNQSWVAQADQLLLDRENEIAQLRQELSEATENARGYAERSAAAVRAANALSVWLSGLAYDQGPEWDEMWVASEQWERMRESEPAPEGE